MLRLTRTKASPLHHHHLLFKPLSSSSSSSSPAPPVAIFWDLNNKPPSSILLYDAAFRLRLAASSLGPVRLSVAYASPNALRNPLRRRAEDPASSSFVCRVCARNFYRHSSLLNHFSTVHQTEQAKRLTRLSSARGARRVALAAQLSQKIDKYKKAAREILIPEAGYGPAEELARAGVKVRAAEPDGRAMRRDVAEEMDRGRIGCFVLVSDDAGLIPAVREMRVRHLRTVVVGDEADGALRRCADAGFLWREVVSGKARKEAGTAVGKWKDRDLLKRLEWRYQPEEEEEESGWEESDGDVIGEGLGLTPDEDSEPWWKLDANSGDSVVRSAKL
ncbi:uncharacterized protein M6B38_228755 [Iris pallida]|uniref:C2H2-type domain-containing protein n=1 Tax=Iris pallida TaxID=29817 RepID=A0AAX6DTI0_IRIPA|nr:uncharacterized protein M6B38_228755 [Iris pallida]